MELLLLRSWGQGVKVSSLDMSSSCGLGILPCHMFGGGGSHCVSWPRLGERLVPG